jgi:hypothetical protein
MKTKMMVAKFHEEKLKLQQKHDADVQKVSSVLLIFIEYINFLDVMIHASVHL